MRVIKFNPVTKALEGDEYPYDVKPLFSAKKTATASGSLDMGAYTVPTNKIAIITGVKYAATTTDTWFEFSGGVTDYSYLAPAGEGMLAGSPDNPVWTLDQGEVVSCGVANAESGATYAVVVYGRLRDRTFKGLTPQG